MKLTELDVYTQEEMAETGYLPPVPGHATNSGVIHPSELAEGESVSVYTLSHSRFDITGTGDGLVTVDRYIWLSQSGKFMLAEDAVLQLEEAWNLQRLINRLCASASAQLKAVVHMTEDPVFPHKLGQSLFDDLNGSAFAVFRGKFRLDDISLGKILSGTGEQPGVTIRSSPVIFWTVNS